MSKLTAVQVRNTKPKKKAYKISDGYGMYLHVAPSGLKTWRYRFKINNQESTYTLGQYPAMSLEKARIARMNARELVREGKNPSQLRKEKRRQTRQAQFENTLALKNTFKNIAIEWVEIQRGAWTKQHADAVLNSLRIDAFPKIGSFGVETISPPMILDILRTIEARGAQETAKKVLQRMNAIFRFAIQTGRAAYNPAAEMKGVLKPQKVNHRAAITEKELPKFLRDLRWGDIHITTKMALEFTILTAARSGEVRGATWDEINLEECIWKIPSERMKMKTTHLVPLANQTLTILDRAGKLYGKTSYIFPGIRQSSKQLSENTMLYALYRLGYHSKATVHGFRATFSTIANENGFSPDVIEKALAHEERNRVRAAYHRSEYIEQRRELMQWWANYLNTLEQRV